MSEHIYLYRAKNTRGRTVTDQIMASSADHALSKLKDTNLTEIELCSDDVYSRAGENEHTARLQQNVSPEVRIRLRGATRAQVKWLMIVNLYRKLRSQY